MACARYDRDAPRRGTRPPLARPCPRRRTPVDPPDHHAGRSHDRDREPDEDGQGRAVDLDATTIAELRAHRARQAQELLLLGIRADGDTLVFCHPDARPYNPERFSRECARALDRHPELPRIRLHDLRHTWATLALAAGVPVKIVSERLGHSTTASRPTLTPTSRRQWAQMPRRRSQG